MLLQVELLHYEKAAQDHAQSRGIVFLLTMSKNRIPLFPARICAATTLVRTL